LKCYRHAYKAVEELRMRDSRGAVIADLCLEKVLRYEYEQSVNTGYQERASREFHNVSKYSRVKDQLIVSFAVLNKERESAASELLRAKQRRRE
jgi:hypothetical protein